MTDHYTIISSDTHAGGSHAMYREFLDPAWHDEFDAWRGEYRNPYADLGDNRRLRNWDDELRNSQQDADGVVGEVIFPNTVPPFFPSFVLFAPPPSPEDYPKRLAGIRAHNRWLADFCARFPERRAGIGQVFLNDIDDAIEDAIWIREHGLRGGILLPNIPPDVSWIRPLNDPEYDRFWKVCEDLELPVNCHGGTGLPRYGPFPSSKLISLAETGHYSRRPLTYLLMSGVFERFPKLRFVMTEQGCTWLPGTLQLLDSLLDRVRRNAIGELRFSPDEALPRSATDYVKQNLWLGVSFPTHADITAAVGTIGIDRVMWGSDFPHDEGTSPFTREHLRQLFHSWTAADLRKLLSENAACLYNFDLPALAPRSAAVGPTVEEIARPLDRLPDKPNEALLRNLVDA